MIYSSPKWKICRKVKSNPQSKGVDSIFEDFKSVDLISQEKCFCDIGHFKRSIDKLPGLNFTDFGPVLLYV